MRFRLVPLPCFVALLAMLACGSTVDELGASSSSCPNTELIVAASDYSPRSSRVCGAPGECTGGVDLGDDPMLTTSNGRAFFVARTDDLLFEIDPSCGKPIGRMSVNTFALNDPATGRKRYANPHDIAAAPDGTLVVPLYNVPRVAFFTGGKLEPTSIDLGPYDPDGNPQADAVSIVDVGGVSKAFVTLERLDDKDLLRSKQASQMLRIDVATRSVDFAIDLKGRNPFNPMSQLGAMLFMAEPGNFDTDSEDLAGIERFDTATSTSELLVHESALGGSVAEVAVTEGCGAAIIAGPQKTINPTSVVTFDPSTGRAITTAAGPALGPTPGYDLQGLAWRGDLLYVGDRRRSGSVYPVHVLQKTPDCKLIDTGRTIDLEQSPVALRAARP